VIQHKDLYRKLSIMLGEIDTGSYDANYLLSVLARLENSFTRDLRAASGRLYAEDQGHFLSVTLSNEFRRNPADGSVLNTEAARLVVMNGIYIFNDPPWGGLRQDAESARSGPPAAFTVRDPSRQWIFVFDLEEGWIREEIEFCFNAIRSQLNFQLHINAMNSDIEQAAVIQLSLLPNAPPAIAGYETAGRCQPAGVMGGDFFDFSVLDGDFFTVAVGDAVGHGLPAALLVRDVVTGLRMGVEKEMRMAEAMQKLNRVIHRSTLSSHFVSLFFAQIESTGNILYVNAGHPPPVMVLGSQARRLESTGMILGAVSDAQFRRASVNFEPGGVLLIYTDGAVERRNGAEEFGLARLAEIVVQHQEESAADILDRIHRAVTLFGDPPAFADDFTLVVIKKV
jgi:sigma-B regulation protein RsbU (phosphoserine phosphatase)